MGGYSAGRAARITTSGPAPKDHDGDVLSGREVMSSVAERCEWEKQ